MARQASRGDNHEYGEGLSASTATSSRQGIQGHIASRDAACFPLGGFAYHAPPQTPPLRLESVQRYELRLHADELHRRLEALELVLWNRLKLFGDDRKDWRICYTPVEILIKMTDGERSTRMGLYYRLKSRAAGPIPFQTPPELEARGANICSARSLVSDAVTNVESPTCAPPSLPNQNTHVSDSRKRKYSWDHFGSVSGISD